MNTYYGEEANAFVMFSWLAKRKHKFEIYITIPIESNCFVVPKKNMRLYILKNHVRGTVFFSFIAESYTRLVEVNF